MAFLPVEQQRIGKGLTEGPEYALPVQCQAHECDYMATDKHHVVRRSHLGGPYDWVEIDGVARPNLLNLCMNCHEKVERNEVKIYWDEGEWAWGMPGVPVRPYLLLDSGLPPSPEVTAQQPALPGKPTVEQVSSEVVGPSLSTPAPKPGLTEGDLPGYPLASDAMGRVVGARDTGTPSVSPGETCPTCQRRVNHKKKPDSPESATVKVSDTYSFRLPADEKAGLKELVAETAQTIGFTALKYPASKTIEAGMVLMLRHVVEAREILKEMSE